MYMRRQIASRGRQQRLGDLGVLPAVAVAAPALATNPVGWVVLGVSGLLSIFGAIFSHHSKAVAVEAATLNAAAPAFAQQLQQIFAAANAKQITAAQASGFIDQMVQAYYSNVGSIIKKAGPCNLNADCKNPVWPPAMDPCNGPCSVGCSYIEPAACMAKKILVSGGTVTVPGIGAHAGFTGAPELTLSYSAPIEAAAAAAVSPGGTVADSSAAGFSFASVPTWAWAAGGAALGAMVLGGGRS